MIQPIIGLPGATAAKLAAHREVFLHPDKVVYRSSTRLLHRLSLDWESEASPQTLKAGTILALRKVSSSDPRSYWMPWVLTTSHSSYTGGTSGPHYILLPITFQAYAAELFPSGARFTRVKYRSSGELEFTHIASNGGATTFTLSGVTYVAIPVASIANDWADDSILLYHGIGVGPTGTSDVFIDVEAFSIVPGNTLVDATRHTQLHHYPWSGVVLGSRLYPPSKVSTEAATRQKVLKALAKEATSRGFSGLIVDEVN